MGVRSKSLKLQISIYDAITRILDVGISSISGVKKSIHVSERIYFLIHVGNFNVCVQLVVEKMLATQGISRTELGRTEFLNRVWEWKEKYEFSLNCLCVVETVLQIIQCLAVVFSAYISVSVLPS